MRKVMINDLLAKKKQRRPIAMLTAYDYPFAQIVDEAGVDIVLVGDSLGNVALGYKNTLPVTMEEMVIHTKAVARGVNNAFIVADMPFGSFQVDDKKAVANAITLIKAGAEGVKIEGKNHLTAIKMIIQSGIPVMGHLGFTPQSVNLLGYKTQGANNSTAREILVAAKVVEKAGCFALVLELVPETLAAKIAKILKIPVIGIGAGDKVDGQVLVSNDLLGLYENPPSFVRPKANLRKAALTAVKAFIGETRKLRPRSSVG